MGAREFDQWRAYDLYLARQRDRADGKPVTNMRGLDG